MKIQRRYLQSLVHPQLFRQTVQLTDGSTVRVASVSKGRVFLKVGLDSLCHPSWNPQLRSRMHLSEHGEVSKFKERFAGMNEDVMDGLNDFVKKSGKEESRKIGTAKLKSKK